MVKVNKTPYKSIEVETVTGLSITISENDEIRFITENGELKKGTVIGFKGTKSENVEVEFIPSGSKHKETWAVIEMEEGSFNLIDETEDSEDED